MQPMLAKLLLLLGSLLILARNGSAFIVSVDAHNEECFFENVEGGTKFGKIAERLPGSSSGINASVLSPDRCHL